MALLNPDIASKTARRLRQSRLRLFAVVRFGAMAFGRWNPQAPRCRPGREGNPPHASPAGRVQPRKGTRKKSEKNSAKPQKCGIVPQERTCSLTSRGPRGRDFPQPATGIRRRDAGGAGRLAPGRFAAKSPDALRLPHSASATGGAFHFFGQPLLILILISILISSLGLGLICGLHRSPNRKKQRN
jgi:hypothetical protein